MEKRWTRKKRAAREAGGQEPTPALSDAAPIVPAAETPEPETIQPAIDLAPQPKTGARRRPQRYMAPDPTGAAPAEPEMQLPETPEPQNTKRPMPDTSARPTRTAARTATSAPNNTPDDPASPEPEQTPDIKPTRPAAARVSEQPAADRADAATARPRQSAPVSEMAAETASEPAAKPAPVADPAPAVEPAAVPTPALQTAPDGWDTLKRFEINARQLERNRIITATREDPVHSAFDVLRTKLLRAMREKGWTRVAVTSPTEGCGKTFTAANLALSLSRQSNCRTIVLDLDMRHPALAKVMNIPNPPDITAFLRGETPAEDFLMRPGKNTLHIGENIAFGVAGRREEYAAELLQDQTTAETLDRLQASLSPDLMLFDMPPALANDDVLAARSLYDGIILIVGGGITKPQQVRDVERRLGVDTPLLGVVLNKSEGDHTQAYAY